MRVLSTRSKRGVAAFLVAMLAFVQANVAFATCQMDRSAMAQAIAAQASEPCGDCESPSKVAVGDVAVGAACVAHCTSDLQAVGHSVFDASVPAAAPLVVLPHTWPAAAPPPRILASPPRTIPARVLLHSYLI